MIKDTMFTISWGEHERVEVESAGDVDGLLDELHQRHLGCAPQLVTVELKRNGDSLAIGVGRGRSVLNYVSGNKDPPYFTSTGEMETDEPIAFWFNGALSEFPMRNSVPIEIARRAMRYFCANGALSPDLKWEED